MSNGKKNFSDIGNDGKHNWTKDEINDWFIASRSGSVVYMIIK